MTRLVIVGLSTGGFAALLSARKFDPGAEITVVDEKPFDLLHVCGLPYALEGIMPLENLKHDIGAARMGVKIVRGKARGIDAKNKKLFVGEDNELDYDSLIIATGASALVPPIPGVKELLGKNVFTVYGYNDTVELEKACAFAKKAVVIGGGAIGLEVAVSLRKKGLSVTVVEAEDNVLPRAVDADMAVIVEGCLKASGIELLLGASAEKVTEKSVFAGGIWIECDIVVLSVGISPNTLLAQAAGAEKNGRGLKVDEYLKTNLRDVYAVGDVIDAPNIVNGGALGVGLANSAYIQGTIAGQNALGGKKKYAGTSVTFVTVLGALEVASTGFNKSLAEKNGISVVETRARGKNKYDWYPGAEELTVKILADAKTKKIIGCQAIGKDAYARINVVSTAIRAGMRVDELLDVELAYCPPLSEAYDILMVAAELAKRKLSVGRLNAAVEAVKR